MSAEVKESSRLVQEEVTDSTIKLRPPHTRGGYVKFIEDYEFWHGDQVWHVKTVDEGKSTFKLSYLKQMTAYRLRWHGREDDLDKGNEDEQDNDLEVTTRGKNSECSKRSHHLFAFLQLIGCRAGYG